MSTLVEILAGVPALPQHHPWPRYRVTPAIWEELGRGMAEGRLDLMALFGDAAEVHLVAFEPSVQWEVTKVGGLKSLVFSGEGLVCRFSGQGKLWLQTRSFDAFIGQITPYLQRASN